MNTIALSLSRVKQLFIEYFVINWKRDVSIFLGLFLVSAILAYQHWLFPSRFFIFIISILLIGVSNPLGKELRGMNYLICPAKTAEKLLVNIVLVHIYYTVALVLVCGLATSIAFFLNPLNLEHFTVLDKAEANAHFYRFYLTLFLFQSFFMFASIYFKKNALLKTVLFFGILFLVCLISGIIFFHLPNRVEAIGNLIGALGEDELKYIISYTVDKYAWISQNLVYAIATVFFWVLSYLRLRETEV
jgi:hypothetical protein